MGASIECLLMLRINIGGTGAIVQFDNSIPDLCDAACSVEKNSTPYFSNCSMKHV